MNRTSSSSSPTPPAIPDLHTLSLTATLLPSVSIHNNQTITIYINQTSSQPQGRPSLSPPESSAIPLARFQRTSAPRTNVLLHLQDDEPAFLAVIIGCRSLPWDFGLLGGGRSVESYMPFVAPGLQVGSRGSRFLRRCVDLGFVRLGRPSMARSRSGGERENVWAASRWQCG